MSTRSENLTSASSDLRMALRCSRELIKQKRVSPGVWEAADEWQAKAFGRWRAAIDEMGEMPSCCRAKPVCIGNQPDSHVYHFKRRLRGSEPPAVD